MMRLRSCAAAVLALAAPAVVLAAGTAGSNDWGLRGNSSTGQILNSPTLHGTMTATGATISAATLSGSILSGVTTAGSASLSTAEFALLDGHTHALIDTAYGGSLALSDLTTSGYLTASGVYAPSAASTFAGVTATTLATSGNATVGGNLSVAGAITGALSGVSLASPTITGTATLTGATLTGGTFTNSSLTSPTLTGTATIAALTHTGRDQLALGATVTAANDTTLGNDGNAFLISGSTQVNAITTTGWPAGARVTLIFTGALTLKYGTSGGAGTALLIFTQGADITTYDGLVMEFMYIPALPAWFQVGGKTGASLAFGGSRGAMVEGAVIAGLNTHSAVIFFGVTAYWATNGGAGNITWRLDCDASNVTVTQDCATQGRVTFATPIAVLPDKFCTIQATGATDCIAADPLNFTVVVDGFSY